MKEIFGATYSDSILIANLKSAKMNVELAVQNILENKTVSEQDSSQSNTLKVSIKKPLVFKNQNQNPIYLNKLKNKREETPKFKE